MQPENDFSFRIQDFLTFTVKQFSNSSCFDLQGPLRVARPPGEGRGRNQLLPRYWPRITDQELKQINSGEYPLIEFLIFVFNFI